MMPIPLRESVPVLHDAHTINRTVGRTSEMNPNTGALNVPTVRWNPDYFRFIRHKWIIETLQPVG